MPRTSPATSGNNSAPARKRRGFPVLPTLLVLLAVPALSGLGVWQWQRHIWKDALLAQYRANIDAPLADRAAGAIADGDSFRRVRLPVSCPAGIATERAGRNLSGAPGFSHLRACTSGARALLLDAGWSARTGTPALAAFAAPVSGRLVGSSADGWVLVTDEATPPFQPSAAPSLESIPNNHLSYAFQWFSFALILLVIYALWLRRWLARDDIAA